MINSIIILPKQKCRHVYNTHTHTGGGLSIETAYDLGFLREWPIANGRGLWGAKV